MANPAIPGDVAARFRTLTAAEEALALVLLDDAWADLTASVPSLEDRMDDETLSTSVVIRVLASMVVRVLRNPDGKVSESIDDYTYRRADAVADGVLYATADELRLLSPTANRRSGSVRLIAYHDA